MQSEIDGPGETDSLKQCISELKLRMLSLKPELRNWKTSNRKMN